MAPEDTGTQATQATISEVAAIVGACALLVVIRFPGVNLGVTFLLGTALGVMMAAPYIAMAPRLKPWFTYRGEQSPATASADSDGRTEPGSAGDSTAPDTGSEPAATDGDTPGESGAATDDSPAAGDSDTTETDEESLDAGDEYQPPPVDTPAGTFVQACDSVERIRPVDTSSPVHVYDGQYVDRETTTQARIYALAPGHADEDDAVEAFETSVREWTGISKNTHVATIHGSGDDPQPWVAFDSGIGRLDDVLSSLESGARVNAVVHFAEAVRTASMYNLTHGNISPAVAFIDEDLTDTPITTLGDWGLQRSVERAVADLSPTPYTSPEQLAGETAGTETDMYQLGAVAYRLLTGQPPFADADDPRRAIVDGDLTPPTDRNRALPDTVDDIITEAMATDPGDRLQPYDFRQRLVAATDS